MNELLANLQSMLRSRSPRERWGLVLVCCVLTLIVVQSLGISPLRSRLGSVTAESEKLETDLLRVARMAREIRQLQAELERVEGRIKPGQKTNLFTLLENLAAESNVKERLESIKPKQPSGNDRYPETRVEVQLKGATLGQTVEYLYRIENAPVLLIIRSVRIKTRGDGSQLLDVSFSVSSFERA